MTELALYANAQLGLAHVEAPYHYDQTAPNGYRVEYRRHWRGFGPTIDAALGARIARVIALAGEVGGGVPWVPGTVGDHGIGPQPYLRAGLRLEWIGARLFARAAGGVERRSFGVTSTAESFSQSAKPSPSVSPYASATVGVRWRGTGVFLRVEVSRHTLPSATLTPVAVVIGVDFVRL